MTSPTRAVPASGHPGMAERIGGFDWERTTLGPMAEWPHYMRTLVDVMLAAGQPMFIALGQDRITIYNDAYAPLLSEKDVHALGRPFFGIWPETREFLEPLFDRVFAGESIQMDDIALMLRRGGRLEEAHFAFSYTPVRDGAGVVQGLFCPCTETTQRVLADRRLVSDRLRLSALFEQAPTFMAMLEGPQHRFEMVNPAYTRLVGHRQVVGLTVAEALPDAAEQGFVALLDTVYQTKEAYSALGMKYAVQASPGGPVDERFVDFVFQPLTDESDEVVGIFVAGADETDRALAERATRDLNDTLAQLVEERTRQHDRVWRQAHDVIVIIDGNGIFRDVNPAATKILGWSSREMIGASCFDFIHPDDHPPGDGTRIDPARYEGSRTFVNRYKCKSGSYRWMSWTASYDDGRVYAYGRDIHEERQQAVALAKRTEDLERSEARATLFFNMAPEYLLLLRVDGDGRVVFEDINPATEQVFGRARSSVIGFEPNAFLYPESATVIESNTRRCLATGTTVTYSATRTYREGITVHIDATVTLVSRSTDGGGLVLFTGRDVSEQRQMEEQLRQSQKMEAVGQLTGGLAHDFNNLLAGISGSLELIGLRIGQGRFAELDRYMVAAQGAARRAAALTHRLLAFSRRQTLEPKTTDVNTLIGGMEDLVRRTVGPSVAIEVVGATGLWPALVDPPQLENALLNLCINARDAMPDGGRITIETHNKWLDDHAARTHDMPAGQYLSVCVTDTGTGMPAAVVAKAFDPFFTTKPIGEGTGLGLSMIYGFARQSGGQVRIYSEVGQGTTVCIYLPRHYGEAARDVGTETREEAERAKEGETVLVVDDEPTVRMLVTDVLADLGYQAIEASDSVGGLKILQSDVRIDLLVTDVGLPGGMNGRQMADAGRVKRPDLKVLFITGYAENAVLGHGHLAPGMTVLTKPFVLDVLTSRIRELVAL